MRALNTTVDRQDSSPTGDEIGWGDERERGGVFEGEGSRDAGKDAIGNNYGVGIGGFFLSHSHK